jgi:retinol dehydrogenase 12
MTTVSAILYNQLFVSLPYPTFDLTGQTYIVTGSNTGLGREAARHLVRLNAEKVILAVRSIEKGEDAKASIEESTNRKGVLQVWHLDLSSHDSVKQFVQRCNNELNRLDCIIQNAALAYTNYRAVEGYELSLAVNVINTFLLGILLLPLLRKMAPRFNIQPRLTFVMSEVHGLVSLPKNQEPNIFDALSADTSASAMRRRYGVTKLLGVLLTRELAARMDRVSDHSVIINSVNPGFCVSELQRDAPLWIRPFAMLMVFFLARTTEVGSRTEIFGATASSDTHGKYMNCCRVEP